MAGSTRERSGGSGAAPLLHASSLRQLAAALPSFDQALDDFIARAHQTELAVGDDDVIATESAPDPARDPEDAVTDPGWAASDREDAVTDPGRSGQDPEDAMTDPGWAASDRKEAVTDPGRSGRYRKDAMTDPGRSGGHPEDAVTDPGRSGRYPEDAVTDPGRSGRYPEDAMTDPGRAGQYREDAVVDPRRAAPATMIDAAVATTLAAATAPGAAEAESERAEAQQIALRAQLVAMQRRVATTRPGEATASPRRWGALSVAAAFAGGILAMFAVSRFVLDHPDLPVARPEAATPSAPAPSAMPARPPAPIVTPIRSDAGARGPGVVRVRGAAGGLVRCAAGDHVHRVTCVRRVRGAVAIVCAIRAIGNATGGADARTAATGDLVNRGGAAGAARQPRPDLGPGTAGRRRRLIAARNHRARASLRGR